MNHIITWSVSSMTRMKPGDMFNSINGLSVIIDVGHKVGDPISGFSWDHKFRLAIKEETLVYEVMQS